MAFHGLRKCRSQKTGSSLNVHERKKWLVASIKTQPAIFSVLQFKEHVNLLGAGGLGRARGRAGGAAANAGSDADDAEGEDQSENNALHRELLKG